MRGVIFTGGESPGPEAIRKIAKGADLLVAADSGLAACEDAGLRPDWVLGDMDSLETQNDLGRLEKYPPQRVLRFPPEKDFTDTELALALLEEKGCDEIWISGGGGGRLDHLFAIRSLFERDRPPARWFPGNVEIRCLNEGGKLGAVLPPGSIVSVFPLGKEGWEAESAGLKWPLDGVAWKAGSFGEGNVALEGLVKIRAIRGRFMVIMPMVFGADDQ